MIPGHEKHFEGKQDLGGKNVPLETGHHKLGQACKAEVTIQKDAWFEQRKENIPQK